jgi:hypothetical protein
MSLQLMQSGPKLLVRPILHLDVSKCDIVPPSPWKGTPVDILLTHLAVIG